MINSTPSPPVRGVNTFAALLAGFIAVLVNLLVLRLGPLLGIVSEQGGLLKLVRQLGGAALAHSALAQTWLQWQLPAVDTLLFKNGFHVLVALFMALGYAWVVEPLLPRWPAWLKGLAYAVLLWLVNAGLILPALGQGFAGHLSLDLAGMSYFAFAHTLFFLLLALLYGRLRKRSR